mmetsp:Transcript_14316/g.43512  ORF Transcript_14316/g.43512 Transcript_14316/m.43512 type:complete len:226 (-) Transcript_14316:1796-2473(-)
MWGRGRWWRARRRRGRSGCRGPAIAHLLAAPGVGRANVAAVPTGSGGRVAPRAEAVKGAAVVVVPCARPGPALRREAVRVGRLGVPPLARHITHSPRHLPAVVARLVGRVALHVLARVPRRRSRARGRRGRPGRRIRRGRRGRRGRGIRWRRGRPGGRSRWSEARAGAHAGAHVAIVPLGPSLGHGEAPRTGRSPLAHSAAVVVSAEASIIVLSRVRCVRLATAI